MTVAYLSLAAAWWLTWIAVHLLISRRGTGHSAAVLLAYEIVFVPFLLAAALVWVSNGKVPSGAHGSWSLPLSLGIGVLAGAAAWAVLTGLRGVPALTRKKNRRRLAVGAAVAIWDAICEELMFRGLLLLGLIAVTGLTWTAAGLAALLFGLHHLPVGGPRVALMHTGSGAVFGAVLVLGGGLVGAAAAHVTYNLAAVSVREAEITTGNNERRRTPLRRLTS